MVAPGIGEYLAKLADGVAAVAMVAVALVASAVPAWRASLLSPMVAIRDQPESVWQAARQKVE